MEGSFSQIQSHIANYWLHSIHYILFITVGSLNKSITITEQPKDQTIQFENDEATVELTCLAEPPAGHDLRYEWYCVDSSDIISDKHFAEIRFERSCSNMEKKYYCKVSIANKPIHHVTSRLVVIKLEISKLINNHNIIVG